MTDDPRTPAAAPDWHRLHPEEVAERLRTGIDAGLDDGEAGRRLGEHGANELAEGRRRSPWLMLLGQFTDFMIVVLLAAAVVAGVVGEPQDSAVIVVIVVLNAIIGFAQEWRAEKTMAALRQLGAPHARVVRASSPYPSRSLSSFHVAASVALAPSTAPSPSASTRPVRPSQVRTAVAVHVSGAPG